MRESASRRIFVVFNYALFTLFCLSIILPFINVLAISFSAKDYAVNRVVGFVPLGFTFNNYIKILSNTRFQRIFLNTVFLTAVRTAAAILIALGAGFALASKYFIGKKVVWIYILISMYFSGGLIPTYILVVRWLKLGETWWALILPAIVNTFYIMVFRNLISQLPGEMSESAEIDGASQMTIMFRIILPLIFPTIAAFIVFSAVGYWNSWFDVMIYLQKSKDLWTLQYLLREILAHAVLTEDQLKEFAVDPTQVYTEGLKMAALMVTILPIIVVYPFVQRYFMSGVLVGAVKG